MSVKIIQERLDGYEAGSIQEEEMALREITQEVALNALYNAGFFKKAAFHGGTCLRIFYSLNRFSEDLDFALLESDPSFYFRGYLDLLKREFSAFGYDIEVLERNDVSSSVKSIFIKDDSVGKILLLRHPRLDGRPKKISIKLEVDTNPPKGAKVENKYHDFPLNFSVIAHDLPSLFAGKIHALLTRAYVKGRDWYDFLWYAGRRAKINYVLLSNALGQTGHLTDKKADVSHEWVLGRLSEKISSINWQKTRQDVHRFLKANELKSLELWEQDFFRSKLKNL